MRFKKLLSVIVTAAVSVGGVSAVMPSSAELVGAVAADEDVFVSGLWEYVLVDGGVRVVKHDLDEQAEFKFDNIVTLPEKLDGKKVVSFAECVFGEDKFTRMISVPDNTVEFDDDWLSGSQISYIYYEDFQFYLSIDSRYLHLTKWSKKKTKAQNAFDDEPVPVVVEETTSAVPLAVGDDVVYDLVIPEKVAGYTVRGLEYNALSGAVNIGKLTLPDTITSLSSSDLMNTSITSVNIPKGVKYVCDDCFKGCTQLSEVKFHDDIIVVSSKAFPDSPDVKIPPEYDDPYATAYSSSMQSHGTKRVGDWVLYFYDFSGKETTICLREYLGSDTVLTVPSVVGGYTINGAERLEKILANNSTVEEVIFDEGVTKLPSLGSNTMKKVTIPQNVTELRWEFADCTSLTSVIVPPNVTGIIYNAFAGCSNLSEVTITGDKMRIGSGKSLEDPFGGTAIEKLVLPGNCTVNQVRMPASLKEISFTAGDLVTYRGGAYSSTNLKSMIFDPDIKEVVIGSSAFRNSNIEKIAFPNGKVTIEANAFRGCTNLKEVVFNGEVEIATNAFSECPQLEKVVLGDKCKVDDLAFSDCPRLADVHFDTTQDISARAFNGCRNLLCINGTEVVPEGSTEPAEEFVDYFYGNCHTAYDVGFIDRFTMNNVKAVVADTIDDSMNDMQKIRALHDWVCNNTVYDSENENYLGNHVDSAVFMDGTAVCEGYAKAYDLLLHEAGIESCCVKNSYHAWNIVKLGDNWFHSDTTWDDGDTVTYGWFLCTDSDKSASEFGFDSVSYLHGSQLDELPQCSTIIGDLDDNKQLTFDDAAAIYLKAAAGEGYDLIADISYDGKLSASDVAAALKALPDNKHDMGDVNGDGKVDSSDASLILAEYSRLSTDGENLLTREQVISADLNSDGKTDSSDASKILGYYSHISTGGADDIVSFLS
ncbi:Transglutaminase-like superfamily protein [Ruminococcus sp. YRD2003]|uniref:leucine-rich repeat protein n=1 Tax=Ruminococcus sp. YRD2003 TaxID=1452313 RepID=UPI0008ABFDA8|nr:Transglutaminase-like superfamily protein [Ruminococcus flavefaciens]